jgi:predicted O-methyltransferase YrrM
MKWPYRELMQPQTVAVLDELYNDFEAAGVSDQSILSFLTMYLRIKQPTQVIELGTWIGCSCLVMADVLANNDNVGQLVTVDPAEDKQAKARQYVLDAGLFETVTFLPGESCDEHVLLYLRDNAPYEVVYIDSLHGYENMLKELGVYCPGNGIVDKDGIMILHDASHVAKDFDPTKRGGVRRALDEWILEHDEMQMLILEPPAWTNPCGIGIITRKTEEISETTNDYDYV